MKKKEKKEKRRRNENLEESTQGLSMEVVPLPSGCSENVGGYGSKAAETGALGSK